MLLCPDFGLNQQPHLLRFARVVDRVSGLSLPSPIDFTLLLAQCCSHLDERSVCRMFGGKQRKRATSRAGYASTTELKVANELLVRVRKCNPVLEDQKVNSMIQRLANPARPRLEYLGEGKPGRTAQFRILPAGQLRLRTNRPDLLDAVEGEFQ